MQGLHKEMQSNLGFAAGMLQNRGKFDCFLLLVLLIFTNIAYVQSFYQLMANNK
jgi:hypothetical protein